MKQRRNINIDWHRAFSMAIKSCVGAFGYRVETEVNVNEQKQILDLIIIHQDQVTLVNRTLCDGFDNLAKHNLVSYKSLHESFNTFAVEELYSYYVNYIKLPQQQYLKLNKEDYKLYGITTKQPDKLLQSVRHKMIKPGVYDLDTGLKPIRLLVLNTLMQKESNAILNLFSSKIDNFKYGYEHIDKRSFNTKHLPVLSKIIKLYKLEGITMPYTEEQFLADYKRDIFNDMTPEEKLTGLKPEERLAGLKPQEILANIKPQERLAGLKPQEILAGLKPDDLKELEQYLQHLKK